MGKSKWLKLQRGVLSLGTGKISNIVVQKNGVIRIEKTKEKKK